MVSKNRVHLKKRRLSNLESLPTCRAFTEQTREASKLLFVPSKSQLTCAFFALNTGNVFSHSPRRPGSDRSVRHAISDTARDGRSNPKQKISEMLCLARDQCEGAILSCGFNSRAEQKRLSTARALLHCAQTEHPFHLWIQSDEARGIPKEI